MMRLVQLFFIFLFFIACQSETSPQQSIDIVESFPSGSVKVDQLYEMHNGKKVAHFQREYYEDGTLLKEGPLKHGKMDGLWKSYYNTGILWSEGEFAEGVRNGISNTYHPNGSKYYEGHFTNNEKDSTWRFWREDGSFIKEIYFSKK